MPSAFPGRLLVGLVRVATLAGAAALAACNPSSNDGAGGSTTASTSTGMGGAPDLGGETFDIATTLDAITYVDFDTRAVVAATDGWEIAFDGLNILTNGGISGDGTKGKSFGPFDPPTFLTSQLPANIPFFFEDAPGGPFLDWYYYDGGTHSLYSRFHVYGLRRETERYKLQILGYYGEKLGAPVSALYKLRYARLDSGDGSTQLVEDIDGTAGGAGAGDDAPSECLRLSTGARKMLSPAESKADTDWDVCFRRDAIRVNGGESGAAGVEGVDLQAAETANEDPADVVARTAESELPALDGTTKATLDAPSLVWMSDGVASAFTGNWLLPGASPLAPKPATWIVVGPDGTTVFYLAFDGFEGATSTSLGTVKLRIKELEGTLP